MKDNNNIMLSEHIEYLNGFCVVYQLLSHKSDGTILYDISIEKLDNTTHIQEYVKSVSCTLEEATFIFKVLIANSIMPENLIKVMAVYD